MTHNSLDITKNIKTIEWLKSELLNNVAGLFSALVSGIQSPAQNLLSSFISNLVIILYLLGKRLGIDFVNIDEDIKMKLSDNIKENHDIERDFGDLTELLEHYKNR